MKKKYIISRYSGTKREVKFNTRVARVMAKLALDDGYMPVVPHIYFTQFLDDNNYYDHLKGTEIGLDLLAICDSATIVIIDGCISTGMAAEIDLTKKLGIPTITFEFTKAEIKKLLRESGV